MILQRIHRTVDDMGAPVPEAERIAIGCCPRGASMRDAAGRGAVVLDDDGLAERSPHPLRQDASNGVGRSSGRRANHHRDRPSRIGLCSGSPRERRQRCRACSQIQKSTAGKAHDVLPNVQDEWKAAPRLHSSKFYSFKACWFLERLPADGTPLPRT